MGEAADAVQRPPDASCSGSQRPAAARRPGPRSARHVLLSNLGGSTALLAALAGIGLGLPALDRALPAGQPLPGGQPYVVGGGVVVEPPRGALLDVTKSKPGTDRGSAVFLLGSVRYVVVVEPFTGSIEEAADRLRRKITNTRGYQVAGARHKVTTARGMAGLGGVYTAPGRTGRYAVFLAHGIAIQVTASGSDPALAAVLAGIEASTASLAYRGGP